MKPPDNTGLEVVTSLDNDYLLAFNQTTPDLIYV
jgi:hypothetical protein